MTTIAKKTCNAIAEARCEYSQRRAAQPKYQSR